MATLQVLCPNGRRQNVKITPNSKLLQVLEEVCKKQGYLPPEDYNLVQGRKTLDLTLAFRYCGLVNNSKLELVKSTSSRAEEDVLIALQLEDGSRQQAIFKPSITLWDILLHWENQINSPYKDKLTSIDDSEADVKHPVCIYMREEVIGETALRNTTLKQLGLTGGKAVIRMVHRSVDDFTLAKIIQDIEKSNAKKVKLEDIATQKYLEHLNQPVTHSTSNSQEIAGSASNITRNMETTSDIEAKSNVSSENQEPMEIDTMNINQSESSLSMRNQPDSTISLPDVTTDNSINRLREMNIPGVEIFTPQDFADLSPQEQAIATRLAQRFVPGLMRNNNQTTVSSHSTNSRQQPRQQPTNFTDFKFPEETKGKDVYHNELSVVNREEFKPCDRESILYSLEETLIRSKAAAEELSDDFFEINENDLRIMMTDLQKKVESMDNEILMTKALRQAALEEKYNKYEKVIIRIQFPNKLVLQGLFRPRETVFAVHKYVKENLEDKNMTFYLYTTPPKTLLKDQSQTLLEANLVPATLIHFGSEAEHDSYVSLSLVSSVSPRLKAEELVAKCLKSDEIFSSSEDYKKPKSSKSSNSAGPSTSSPNEPKVPKWLKLGKK